MRKWLRRVTGLSILIGLVGFGSIYDAYPVCEKGVIDPAPELSAPAGLSEEQRIRLGEITSKYRPTLWPLFSKCDAEKAERLKLIRAKNIADSAIRDQVYRIAEIEAEIAVQKAHLVKELRGILTKEQLERLDTGPEPTGAAVRFHAALGKEAAKREIKKPT